MFHYEVTGKGSVNFEANYVLYICVCVCLCVMYAFGSNICGIPVSEKLGEVIKVFGQESLLLCLPHSPIFVNSALINPFRTYVSFENNTCS